MLDRKTLLASLAWAAFQISIIAGTAKPVLFLDGSTLSATALANLTLAKQLVLGSIAIIGFLTGYALDDARYGAQALLVSQAIAYPGLVGIFSLPVIGAPAVPLSSLDLGFALAFLLPFAIFSILVGMVGVLPGAFLGEWFRSRSPLSMDWKLLSASLLLTAPIYALSLLNGWEPMLLSDWGLNLALVSLTLGVGVLVALWGLQRNRFARSEYVGLLFFGSLAASVLSLIIAQYASRFYESCVKLNCLQTQSLLTLLWLDIGSFLPPGIIIFSILFPRYWSTTQTRATLQ